MTLKRNNIIVFVAMLFVLGSYTRTAAQHTTSVQTTEPSPSPYLSSNILGFSGMDVGFRLGRYNVMPRDPFTGRSLLSSVVQESPDKPIQQVNMYAVNFKLYGSLIGHKLLKKRDRKLVVADISEMGLDLAIANESGKQFDGTELHSLAGKTGTNRTIGSLVDIATGILIAYKINGDMRVSLRYQYFIDQGVVFYSWMELDHTRNFDMSRKRLTGTVSYKTYMAEANVGMGWKYGGAAHGNKGWGIGVMKRAGGDNNHIGLKMDFVYQRMYAYGTRNWHSLMFYYGVGL